MSEMIERVAQALFEKEWNGYSTWESRSPENDAYWRTQAIVAIEAMQEPTEAMLHAAFVAMNQTPSGTWKAMKAAKETPRRIFDVKMAPRFRAMMQAALKP